MLLYNNVKYRSYCSIKICYETRLKHFSGPPQRGDKQDRHLKWSLNYKNNETWIEHETRIMRICGNYINV